LEDLTVRNASAKAEHTDDGLPEYSGSQQGFTTE